MKQTHLDKASVSALGGRLARLTSGEVASLLSDPVEPVAAAAASVSELAEASAAAWMAWTSATTGGSAIANDIGWLSSWRWVSV
jgi:hypothetical protein